MLKAFDWNGPVKKNIKKEDICEILKKMFSKTKDINRLIDELVERFECKIKELKARY